MRVVNVHSVEVKMRTCVSFSENVARADLMHVSLFHELISVLMCQGRVRLHSRTPSMKHKSVEK